MYGSTHVFIELDLIVDINRLRGRIGRNVFIRRANITIHVFELERDFKKNINQEMGGVLCLSSGTVYS